MNVTVLSEGIKAVLSLASGFGISAMCGSLASKLTPETNSAIKKVCVTIATGVVSGMISNAATKYISDEVDEYTKAVDTVMNAVNQVKAEQQ